MVRTLLPVVVIGLMATTYGRTVANCVGMTLLDNLNCMVSALLREPDASSDRNPPFLPKVRVD